MIAMLTGTVASHRPGYLVLEVQGVGYALQVPTTLADTTVGNEVRLYTYLAVRDDALVLYGFGSEADRDAFVMVMGVNGVGPKTALAAVDTLGAEGLRTAVVAESLNELMLIPGVGRKGAQKMVLDLREKLSGLPATSTSQGRAIASGLASAHDEARAALAVLGYSAMEIEGAISGLDGTAEAIIHAALRTLARS